MEQKTKDIFFWIALLIILILGFAIGIMRTNKIYEDYVIIENTSSTIEGK